MDGILSAVLELPADYKTAVFLYYYEGNNNRRGEFPPAICYSFAPMAFIRFCIKRYAFSYGGRPEALEKIMERMPAKRVPRSDQGWQVELMPGLEIQFLLWLGDEEFPPNAQILQVRMGNGILPS